MQKLQLTAESRSATGKGAARKLRREGRIPAVLYGSQRDPLPLSLERRDLALRLQAQAGRHLLVDLTVTGDRSEQTLALIQNLDIDPVGNAIEHADFLRVDSNKPIRTTVPVHFHGLPAGVREGGVEQHILRDIEVEALPTDIPSYIEVETSHLHIGDSLHVSDIEEESLPYKIMTEPERALVTVLAPRLHEEVAEEEAEAVEGEELEKDEEGKEAEGEAKEESSES